MVVTVRMRVSAHCADAFLNVSFSGFDRTGVRRLRPVRRQRTRCGIRIKSFGSLFVSTPLCGDFDLCDPDRNQSAVVGCFERTPLCEDCDLCDQKQITANKAAWRYDVVFRGGAWSVEKVFGLVGVQYWHAQMFRLTAFLGQMM